ncbi:MAG: M3 family oligoendopeptidase [Treponema sp.]|nr:M3 family oligoendopeptidase [Treponema sp.]
MQETPEWNLDSIFPSINSDKYKNYLETYTHGIKKLESLISEKKTPFNNWLYNFLKEYENTLTILQTLNAYSYIIYSVDTTNTSYLNNISTIEDFSLQFNKLELDFNQILFENKENLNSFFASYPEYEEYRFILNEKIEDTKHQMSKAEECLAGDLQKTGGNAWDRLHEQIISTLKDCNDKTFNELRNDAYSHNPELRKESYLKEIDLLKRNEVALSACLNNLKGETITLNKNRNWNFPLERTLHSSRINQKTLNSLILAIEKSLPKWREYFIAKAKYLRKNNLTVSKTAGLQNNGIAFYDLFAPIINKKNATNSLLSKKWSYEEAKEYIIEKYTSFSLDMGNFAKNAFNENWIDAKIRPGKVGGAYDEDFALGHQSRILTNFTGTFSDVITLAHELGHAYHFSCLKGKSPLFYNYPMTLAETASTFAETLVKQSMLSNCSKEDKLQLLDMDLQDVGQVLVDILCRFYFEKSVFEEREKSELTANDFNSLMKKAQECSYGNGLNEERHEYMWAVKSHYYSTSLDFYNFPYAFGQLFASALYNQYKQNNSDFPNIYKKLLRNTGSMSCEDLCKSAGFDISTIDFWNSGIEMYINEIEEFCKLV